MSALNKLKTIMDDYSSLVVNQEIVADDFFDLINEFIDSEDFDDRVIDISSTSFGIVGLFSVYQNRSTPVIFSHLRDERLRSLLSDKNLDKLKAMHKEFVKGLEKIVDEVKTELQIDHFKGTDTTFQLRNYLNKIHKSVIIIQNVSGRSSFKFSRYENEKITISNQFEKLSAQALKKLDESGGFRLHSQHSQGQSLDDWFWEIDVENLKDQSKALDSPSVEGLTNVKENQVNRLKLELERLGYKLIQDVNNVLLYRRFVQSVEELIEFHRYRRTVRKFAIKLYGDNREQIEMNNDERDLFLSEEYTII